jgi:MinD superfamily P-loop ATPase
MREIVVISGKGGTGKTSITAALACRGPEKVLADCDVDAADLHLVLTPHIVERHDFYSGEIASIDLESCSLCGLCMQECRFQAIRQDKDGFHIMQEHCEGCGLCAYLCPTGAARMHTRLCGEWFVSDTRHGRMVHARLGIGEENSGKLVTTVRQKSKELAEQAGLGLILTDGPPGIGCPVIASLTNANLAIVVCEPTLSAIHDLERVHALTRHFGIQCMALINKADINPGLAGRIRDICLERDVALLGELAYDQAFTQAQIRGRSVVEHEPQRFGPLFDDFWQRIDALPVNP